MSYSAGAVDVRPLSRVLKALADETRLRIVALLSHGELCVCHVEEALELKQANASRQLGILRSAGIVETRRDASWAYYRIARQDDGDCQRLLRLLVASFARRDVLRKDVERLLRARGPGSCK